MFDQEEMAISNALENNKLVRSVNAGEEIALAKKSRSRSRYSLSNYHLIAGSSVRYWQNQVGSLVFWCAGQVEAHRSGLMP